MMLLTMNCLDEGQDERYQINLCEEVKGNYRIMKMWTIKTSDHKNTEWVPACLLAFPCFQTMLFRQRA